MIPAEFDYVAPASLDEAIQAVSEGGEDAKYLAGGHSLVPLMKLRLAAPTLLVDLRRVDGLSGIRRNGALRIGAMTTHAALAREGVGLLSAAAHTIADPQVRHRGTIGGSLAHGDPASDLPAVVLAGEGELVVKGSGGERTIAAADFFQDYLQTALSSDEVITEVRFPDNLEGFAYGYEKFNRRQEDWAMVAVCALVRQEGGTCSDIRVGLTHMGSTPLRAHAVEEALRGQSLSAQTIAQAAEQAAEGTSPPGDLNASPDYKRHLARVLCRRALEQAVGV
jgi:aerobic carbon-monoxide dehydrogenase medium subunit